MEQNQKFPSNGRQAVTAYYNEFNPHRQVWLKNLIDAGHIAQGDVDGRSIIDVKPDDLKGYTQCHFFAGVGLWSLALRWAGWPDDKPVWTGSCPCQPFSQQGKQKGFDDERHLFPDWFRLISAIRPTAIFGEQAAGKGGKLWWDHVQHEFQNGSYTTGATITNSALFSAHNIRHRLYWMAYANERGCGRSKSSQEKDTGQAQPGARLEPIGRGVGLVDTNHNGLRAGGASAATTRQGRSAIATSWELGECDLAHFVDGKTRAIESGVKPLVTRNPTRVEQVRGYGDAINPHVAAQAIIDFIEFEEQL